MPKFNAASVVEALEWSFRPHVDAEGTVTEPADDKIAEYFTELRKLTAEANAHAEATGKAVDELAEAEDPSAAIAALDDTAVVLAMHKKLAAVHEELCSGSPSAEQMLKLPMRIRTIFYGWLRGELLNPEAVTGGGNAQVTTLRSAAAG